MKIAVIAANGRSGQAFVEKALIKGHIINAGVYGPSNLVPSANLNIIKCDATSESDLSSLIKGQDVVVSFIGHVKGSPKRVQTDAIKKIIKVMQEQKVKRLISLTGTGVRFKGDKITIIDRILNIAVLLVDPNRVKDGIEHVSEIKNSDLDWTVLRVLKLQNIKPSPFALKSHGPTKNVVSREDVAMAAVQVIEDSSFIKDAPILSKV